MLKPNNFGRYNKNDILNNGYRVLDKEKETLYTATEIKEMLQVNLKPEQRLAYCKGFSCKKSLERLRSGF